MRELGVRGDRERHRDSGQVGDEHRAEEQGLPDGEGKKACRAQDEQRQKEGVVRATHAQGAARGVAARLENKQARAAGDQAEAAKDAGENGD